MLRRVVGEPLNLKLNIEDGNEALFVRAFLYDVSGIALSPAFVNLVHQNKGVYSNASALMPDNEQVVAVFRAYTEGTYTTLAPGYAQAMELFEKEVSLNPADFVPTPCAIYVKLEKARINARIEKAEIKAIIKCD